MEHVPPRAPADQIVDICRRLSQQGFVAATDGNVSVRLAGGNVLVTRSGVAKADVGRDDIVEVRPDGTPVRPGFRPSTELAMHLEVYARRTDVHAVCHAHPPFATAFAVAGIPLDRPVLPEVIVTLGPIPVAPYATPSTGEVPASIRPFLEDHDALLLANHGVLTYGRDLSEAFARMEKAEHAAAVIYRAMMLGGAKELTEPQVDRLRAIAPASYGRELRS